MSKALDLGVAQALVDLLRGIRVAFADELQARVELYLQKINKTPVVFRWKYKLDTLSVV